MKDLIAKIIVPISIISLLIPPATGNAQVVEAAAGIGAAVISGLGLFVPTFETNPVVLVAVTTTAGATTITAAATTAETAQDLFEWSFSYVLAALKKQILDMMVDQIVAWIQGGGEPKFVSNWSGFLKDAVNETTGRFIDELGLTDLCEPFGISGGASMKIAIQASLIPIKKFSERAKCTLTDIVENIEDFTEDFSSGGWLAYSESWDPQNNFFGILISASAELKNRQAESSGSLWSEAIAGAGFLGVKKCQKDANGKDIPSTCAIITPGDTIGKITAKAVGTDIDFILEADQIEEYVAAIADAIINRVISEGLGLLSTPNAPPGIVIPRDPNAQPCSGLGGSALTACLKYRQGNRSPHLSLEIEFDARLVDTDQDVRSQFIEQSFLYALKRLPNSNEAGGYLEGFNSGLLKKDFLAQLYNSQEYKIQNNLVNSTNDQFVGFLYQDLLKRTADKNERAVWTDPLDQKTATRESTIKDFIKSEEFKMKFNQFLKTSA